MNRKQRQISAAVILAIFSVVLGINAYKKITRPRTKGRSESERSQRQERVPPPPSSQPTTEPDVKPAVVEGAYILIEKHEDLLNHKAKPSSRNNPFIRLEKEEELVTSDPVLQVQQKSEEAKQKEKPKDPQQKTMAADQAKKPKKELPTLEVTGIVTVDAKRCAIINDYILSQGDCIGEECVVEIKSNSVVLERNGEQRVIRLEPRFTPSHRMRVQARRTR